MESLIHAGPQPLIYKTHFTQTTQFQGRPQISHQLVNCSEQMHQSSQSWVETECGTPRHF